MNVKNIIPSKHTLIACALALSALPLTACEVAAVHIETNVPKEAAPYTVQATAIDKSDGKSLFDDEQIVAYGHFERYLKYPTGHKVVVNVTVKASRPVPLPLNAQTEDLGYIKMTDGSHIRKELARGRRVWSAGITTEN